MKKGVALLITILILAIFSVLVLKSFSISTQVVNQNNEIRLLSQSNRLLEDSKKIVKNTLKDINSTEAYAILFSEPFVIANKNFTLTFTFSPVENGLNINSLLQNSKRNEESILVFETILSTYNVQNIQFFVDLILDTIDEDVDERSYGSEIILKDTFFTNSKIYSQKHFDKIIDYYAQVKDAKNIYKVDWGKYIRFDEDAIDVNFASIELLKILLSNPYINDAFKKTYYENYDDLKIDEDKQAFLNNLNLTFTTSRILVKVAFDDLIKKVNFKFIYDKKANTIENIKYGFGENSDS
ncbi:MAG: hypothetical protein PHE60_01055 [Sulfurospirillaceae bacterium]|nr:hypothetical protein [Sulfurospirillaceae bacterium]